MRRLVAGLAWVVMIGPVRAELLTNSDVEAGPWGGGGSGSGAAFPRQSFPPVFPTLPGDPAIRFGHVGATTGTVEAGSARHVPPGYTLVWHDQFNGSTLDTGRWVVASLRDPVTGDLVPGARGDHLLNPGYAGYVTPEDTYLERGALVLRNRKVPHTGTSPPGTYDYTSGWVMSMHRAHFNTGYVEVRARFPSGDKVWPALWLVAEDLAWGPEWDMWEYFGYRTDVGYDNMGNHLMTGRAGRPKWDSMWLSGFDAVHDCEAWHIYGFEWTSSQAVWTLDGTVVHTLHKNDSINPADWPDEEMYIILNNGVRTASPDTTTTWPNHLVIDYIEVYQ